tara:strand:- start:1446 stop:1865 length:420 start_codon:yes stop_codon:yes gene_type:complete
MDRREAFAQMIAQSEDSGIYGATYDFNASPKESKEPFKEYCERKYNKHYTKRMPRLTNKPPKEKVINLNKYERYWENSTPTGHVITIYSQDNTLLTINCNWPKDYYPRLHNIDKERYGKRSTQRLKKKSKSTRRGKKKR